MTTSMPVTFVTALVLQSGPMFRTVGHYVKNFETLAATGVPILAYIDSRVSLTPSPNVTIIPTTPTFSDIAFRLPSARDPVKDTAEYMQIQLMKLKFLTDAAARADTEFVAWIDFGLFAIFKDPDACARRIREIAEGTYCRDKILIPGIWKGDRHDIWNKICWKYCGGFMIGHRDLVERVYRRQAEVYKSNLPRITWEVNYWVLMSDCFRWYKADHDDSILDARNMS